MAESRKLWVLAGGNGAGKTTFYNLYLARHLIKFVNADVIAQLINPEDPESSSYEAATAAEKIRADLISAGGSFCFETVFSHKSKIDFLSLAKAQGYEIILVYIHLSNSNLNEARVKQRVSEGGHSVPVEKIHARIPRTIENIKTALLIADETRILDNSLREHPFQQVSVFKTGKIEIKVDPLPGWAQAFLPEQGGSLGKSVYQPG